MLARYKAYWNLMAWLGILTLLLSLAMLLHRWTAAAIPLLSLSLLGIVSLTLPALVVTDLATRQASLPGARWVAAFAISLAWTTGWLSMLDGSGWATDPLVISPDRVALVALVVALVVVRMLPRQRRRDRASLMCR